MFLNSATPTLFSLSRLCILKNYQNSKNLLFCQLYSNTSTFTVSEIKTEFLESTNTHFISHQSNDIITCPGASEKLHWTLERKREWAGPKASWYCYENNVTFVDKRSGGSQGTLDQTLRPFLKAFINLGWLGMPNGPQCTGQFSPKCPKHPFGWIAIPFIQLPMTWRGSLAYKQCCWSIYTLFPQIQAWLLHFSQVPDQMFFLERCSLTTLKLNPWGDFSCAPAVKTLCFQCRGFRFNSWWGS